MLMTASVGIAELRAREFPRLDAVGCAYLDYAGAALYPQSLVRRDARRLTRSVMGNPHSASHPSQVSTDAIETARAQVLQLVDADPSDYDVVFTANASAALRIIAESFPFARGSRLVMTADNHNSVNGIRIRARRRGATVVYTPLDDDLRLIDPLDELTEAAAPSLFVFPAQSNFSGIRHPLGCVDAARARGYRVVLDAAAYVPSRRLSLAVTPADFVALSFYKIFGYPTGVGALVVRRDALTMLRRDYFAGGTVQFVSVQNRLARLHDGAPAFEDGTPNFLAMPAVVDGLRWFDEIGVECVSAHVEGLTARLLDGLRELRDRVLVYGPGETVDRGGAVAFNVMKGGRLLDYELVEGAARARRIAIRAGCFCNPGAAEHAFRMDAARSAACLRRQFTIDRFRTCMGNRAVGAVRASMGPATSVEDVDRLVALVKDLSEPDCAG